MMDNCFVLFALSGGGIGKLFLFRCWCYVSFELFITTLDPSASL